MSKSILVESIKHKSQYVASGLSGTIKTQADLTMDASYHELDLSQWVPKNATLIHFDVGVKTGTTGRWFILIAYDESNGTRSIIYCAVNNQFFYKEMWIPITTAQKIKYASQSHTNVNIYLKGWLVDGN